MTKVLGCLLISLKVIPKGDMEGEGKYKLTGGGVGWELKYGCKEGQGKERLFKGTGQGRTGC